MHGRVKVKTTAEQEEAKQKERQQKLKLFKHATHKLNEMRSAKVHDQEALRLLSDVLSANPDLYTMWNFRKEILLGLQQTRSPEELQELYEAELPFTETCLRVNPKSYGAWHHRCWVLDHMTTPDFHRELQLCNKYLELDERNFHCWDYRRFVVQRAGVPASEELRYTDSKIAANFSNYSSWHYRSKLLPLVHPDPEGQRILEETTLLQEFELVQNAAFTDPNDQSAWFYHRWLLGRGEVPLSIVSVHVDISTPTVDVSTPTVVVTFSKFVMVPSACAAQVSVEGVALPGTWTPLKSETEFSNMWMFKPTEGFGAGELSVTVPGCDVTATCTLRPGQNVAVGWGPGYSPNVFRRELSAAAMTVLGQELESCKQLEQLEPDNKWVLLTSVLLMKALGVGQIDPYINRLKLVDPFRRSYYNDLRSKFLIEAFLDSRDREDSDLSLVGRGLTSLYHVEFVSHVTRFDVSNNQLRALPQAAYLHHVLELAAANNVISTCKGVRGLGRLRRLDLSNNSISHVTSLLDLQTCPSLTELDLRDNPIVHVEGFRDSVLEVLPRLTCLNGQRVS